MTGFAASINIFLEHDRSGIIVTSVMLGSGMATDLFSSHMIKKREKIVMDPNEV
jgi:hypothetical protein